MRSPSAHCDGAYSLQSARRSVNNSACRNELFFAAHCNFTYVRCVPISAPYTERFSVSYGESRRLDFTTQSLRCAHYGPLRYKGE